MAHDDWAIVVGVQHYPGIVDLQGPENDARAFYEWVTSPAGGNVRRRRAKLILSSDFGPPFPMPAVAQPTKEAVEKCFLNLRRQALQSGNRVGRRLYIYLAGHGFAPDVDQAALLMANATRSQADLHIYGTYVANWFFKRGCFDEIFLLMDCCREFYDQVRLNNCLFPSETESARFGKIRRFYAYAAGFGLLARERAVTNGGPVRGVFTLALLEGLRGAACEPNSDGQITADSLAAYLYNQFDAFLTEEDRARGDIAPHAEVNYDPKQKGKDFHLLTADPNLPVTIHLPQETAGKVVEIRSGKSFQLVANTIAAPPTWPLTLEPSIYELSIPVDGRFHHFTVNRVGGNDVRF
jgi:hypothetical protein